MNTNVSLSQATKSLECVWDLERIWYLLLCLGVKSRALVLNVLAENLDALKCGGWGVFIAPTTKVAVGRLLSMGAPDSPVRHRTLSGAPATSPNHEGLTIGALTGGATGQSLFTVWCAFWHLLWLCANCLRTVSLAADRWTRPLRWRSLLRWHTGQSGEL
jgi:hypothetical protein